MGTADAAALAVGVGELEAIGLLDADGGVVGVTNVPLTLVEFLHEDVMVGDGPVINSTAAHYASYIRRIVLWPHA